MAADACAQEKSLNTNVTYMFIEAWGIHNWFRYWKYCIRKTVTLIRSTNIKQAKGN